MYERRFIEICGLPKRLVANTIALQGGWRGFIAGRDLYYRDATPFAQNNMSEILEVARRLQRYELCYTNQEEALYALAEFALEAVKGKYLELAGG